MRNERAMLDVIHECVRDGSQAMPAMQEMVYKVPWSCNGREELPDAHVWNFGF